MNRYHCYTTKNVKNKKTNHLESAIDVEFVLSLHRSSLKADTTIVEALFPDNDLCVEAIQTAPTKEEKKEDQYKTVFHYITHLKCIKGHNPNHFNIEKMKLEF